MQHGILGLGMTWGRSLFPGETRAEVEALIPAGYQINVVPENGRPGPWRLLALDTVHTDADGRPSVVMCWPHRHDPRTACRVMARELEKLGRNEDWTLQSDGTVTTPLDYTETVE